MRQRLVLLAGVAVLVALALWQWQADRARGPGTLLSIVPAAVTRIALRLGPGPMEHYEMRDHHWWRVDGTPRRADDGRLGELAATAAAPVIDWRAARDFDPAKIGLAPPSAVLILNGQQLAFGGMSVTGPQTYVRAGSRIALVSVRDVPRPSLTDSVQLPDATTRSPDPEHTRPSSTATQQGVRR